MTTDTAKIIVETMDPYQTTEKVESYIDSTDAPTYIAILTKRVHH